MLYSTDACVKGEKRPHFSLWFGNFFEPYYSDRDLVEKGMKEIREMGFNSIFLDSKLWEDFTAFFETGEASSYVTMQQFMVEKAAENGLGVHFLSLFYNGDNLYPHIRESAPDLLCPPVGRDGNPVRGYRLWDDEQTDAQIRHTVNLYRKLAGSRAAKTVDEAGRARIPCYFYHSPAVMPSFDEEGREVYFQWLKNRRPSLAELNRRYGTRYGSWEDIPMAEIWPEMTREDYRQADSPRMRMHLDNMLFRRSVMSAFFCRLTQGVREQVEGIYLYDCLSQWKYLLPDWVEISERGLDLWELGKYLDSPSFYTLPADAYGEPNAYVVPCEMAALRSACQGRDFVGGLFLGRYLYGDIYSVCTPAQAIASAFGAGATDLFFYGYSGLDDGGNFGKWSGDRKESVRTGLDWFAKTREIAGRRVQKKHAAILFPDASFILDNRNLNEASFRACRNDSLGLYQQLADLGVNADFLSPVQVKQGELSDYRLLVLPSNPFYPLDRDPLLEERLQDFAQQGGTVIASATCGMFPVFCIQERKHEEDSIIWTETITEFSQAFYAFDGIVPIARYGRDGATAIGEMMFGKGKIYACGFDMGACYCEKKHKPVPAAYGRQAQYPLTVIEKTPIEEWVFEMGLSTQIHRGVETVEFEKGMLIINHTSYDYVFSKPMDGFSTCAYFDTKRLPGHQALFCLK